MLYKYPQSSPLYIIFPSLSNSEYPIIGLTNFVFLDGTIPQGTVNPEKYEELKSQIINDLHRLPIETGENLNVEVYDPQEIYNVQNTGSAPDIIFTINNWRCVIIENNPDQPLFEKKSFSNRHTGSHRMDGIFIAYGPDIRKDNKLKNLKIIDVAPTIIHLFDAPIPTDTDGRVLTEIFETESEIAKKRPKYVDPSYYKRKTLKEKAKTKIKELKRLRKI